MKNCKQLSKGQSHYAMWYLLVIMFGAVSLSQVAADNRFLSPITAEGEMAIVEGRLLNRSGNPVTDGSVEIWQTDVRGVYDHPGDSKTASRDPGFQFYGSSPADNNGNYFFRTILPGRYEPRPRHIHVKVRRNGRDILTTQIYFAEDGKNDGVGGSADNLLVDLQIRQSSDGESYAYAKFDIVVDTGERGSVRLTDRQGEGPYYPVNDVSQYDNDLASIEN